MTDSTNPTTRALLRAALASAGRRGKFTILAVALVVLMGAGPLAGSFEYAHSNEPASFSADDAQSPAALELLRLVAAPRPPHRESAVPAAQPLTSATPPIRRS